MPSKIVTDKQKHANALSAMGRTNARMLATKVAARSEARLPAETTSSMIEASTHAVIIASCDELDAAAFKMAQTDETYNLEIADDDAPRRARDESAQKLYSLITEARETLRGIFGADSIKAFGFLTATPQDPAQLVGFARELLANITRKQQEGSLPTPRKGISFDVGALLPEMIDSLEALGEALKKVSLEQRELQTALSEKNAALDAYDKLFSDTAHLLVGLLRFVGEDELAEKVRPSTRRPGRLDNDLEAQEA